MPTQEQIIEAIKTVIDPEIHADIYTLGLIYDIKVGEDGIDILMTLTTPFCPYGDEIVRNVEKALKKFGVEVRVDLTFLPEWKPSEETRLALGLSSQDEEILEMRSGGK
jgi:metal-sulfur cluster biosynthetic enzyme